MNELIFLQPLFKTRIWGGNRLKTDYGYQLTDNNTGECWAISAHKNGETLVKNGSFAGKALSFLWNEHPEIFKNTSKRPFPLMVKILDANNDLSVQVHPNDKFAKEVENDLGKAECWYVLAAKPKATIIYGHNAKTKEEFKALALNKHWDKLLNKIEVKTGDFFDVAPGTVHALGAGNLILEIQQSSDTTYRLYDYDRVDASGNYRELHLEKAFEVTTVPNLAPVNQTKYQSQLINDSQITLLTRNQYFEVSKIDLNGNLELNLATPPYLLMSVIDGQANLNGYSIQKGDHFIIPHTIRKLSFKGCATIISSNEV